MMIPHVSMDLNKASQRFLSVLFCVLLSGIPLFATSYSVNALDQPFRGSLTQYDLADDGSRLFGYSITYSSAGAAPSFNATLTRISSKGNVVTVGSNTYNTITHGDTDINTSATASTVDAALNAGSPVSLTITGTDSRNPDNWIGTAYYSNTQTDLRYLSIPKYLISESELDLTNVNSSANTFTVSNVVNSGFVTDVLVTITATNNHDQALRFNNFQFIPAFSSEVSSIQSVSASDGLVFYNLSSNGSYRFVASGDDIYNIVVAPHTNQSWNFHFYVTSSAPLSSAAITNADFSRCQYSWGDYYSAKPATDGNIDKKYDDFTSGGSSSVFDDIDSQLTTIESSGLGSQIVSIANDLIDIFTTDYSLVEPVLVFPTYSLPMGDTSYKLWDSYEFDFRILETWGFDALILAVRFATVAVVYLSLLSYMIDTWDGLFQGQFRYEQYHG